MTIWLARRKYYATAWQNVHAVYDGNTLCHFVAFRTRREAQIFCDEMRTLYGTDWMPVKFEEIV